MCIVIFVKLDRCAQDVGYSKIVLLQTTNYFNLSDISVNIRVKINQCCCCCCCCYDCWIFFRQVCSKLCFGTIYCNIYYSMYIEFFGLCICQIFGQLNLFCACNDQFRSIFTALKKQFVFVTQQLYHIKFIIDLGSLICHNKQLFLIEFEIYIYCNTQSIGIGCYRYYFVCLDLCIQVDIFYLIDYNVRACMSISMRP